MTLLEKRIVGTIFLLMGVVGVFLPLKPDVIFILLGSALLGSNNRLVMKTQGRCGSISIVVNLASPN